MWCSPTQVQNSVGEFLCFVGYDIFSCSLCALPFSVILISISLLNVIVVIVLRPVDVTCRLFSLLRQIDESICLKDQSYL